MTHYWFGDSWLVGDELELEVPMDNRWDYVFGRLVSNYFGVSAVNCAVSGSAPDSLPWEFNKVADQLQTGDTAFFCLSAPHRTSVLNNEKLLKQITPSVNYNPLAHLHSKQWYKYFDTTAHQAYNYDRTVNLLWLWAQQLQITCYFINIFTTSPDAVMDITPSTAWLLPRDRCLSEFIMPLNGNTEGVVVSNDMSFLTVDQWAAHKEALKEYVHPGYCHPNVCGHQHIAEELIKILENK